MTDPTAAPIGFAALPAEHRARIEAELSPGERLLWATMANPKLVGGSSRLILLGLLALTSATVCLASSGVGLGLLSTRRPQVDAACPPLGVFAGIVAFIGGTQFFDAWTRRGRARRLDLRPYYTLTNSRAVIWVPTRKTRGVEVYAIFPSDVQAVHRLEYPDGTGDLYFSFSHDRQLGHSPFAAGFCGIEEVRQIERLARAVFGGLCSSPPQSRSLNQTTDIYEEPF